MMIDKVIDKAVQQFKENEYVDVMGGIDEDYIELNESDLPAILREIVISSVVELLPTQMFIHSDGAGDEASFEAGRNEVIREVLNNLGLKIDDKCS